METFLYRDRVIEISIIGDAINDELVLECWDLGAGGGRLFRLVRDGDGVLMLRAEKSEIPVALIEKVSTIAGTELP
jgi:hypothetical protein